MPGKISEADKRIHVKILTFEFYSQITTGKLGIDLERTMVIHDEKNPNIWKTEVTLDIIIMMVMMTMMTIMTMMTMTMMFIITTTHRLTRMILKQRESFRRLEEKISREMSGLPLILLYRVKSSLLLFMVRMLMMSTGRKVGEVRGTRRPSVSEQRAPSAETQKNLRLVFSPFHMVILVFQSRIRHSC